MTTEVSHLLNDASSGADPTSNGAPLPTVSVVLATRQRPQLLRPLVEAILSEPGALEIIVVVDGLDDPESADILAQLSQTYDALHYICQEKGGQMKALERGVLAARGDVVLLMDDDVLPIGPLAAGHARTHQGHDDLVVVGSMPVDVPDGSRPGVASRLYSKSYDGHCQRLVEGAPVLDYLWMGNVSIRRDRCLAVGISSDVFVSPYYTDREFGYRLADSGLVGVYDPSLRGAHLHTRSPDAFLRDSRRQGSGLELLHRMYPDRLGPFDPRLVVERLPYPAYLVLVKASSMGWTPVKISRAMLRIGMFAGKHNYERVETALGKMAQHLMQWHGAKVGELG
jgi:glycosyltransferase involved in cell wall biosynthesis